MEENLFNQMFAAFILKHCYNTNDQIVVDSFESTTRDTLELDFGRLVSRFMAEQTGNEDYLLYKIFDKEKIIKLFKEK